MKRRSQEQISNDIRKVVGQMIALARQSDRDILRSLLNEYNKAGWRVDILPLFDVLKKNA